MIYFWDVWEPIQIHIQNNPGKYKLFKFNCMVKGLHKGHSNIGLQLPQHSEIRCDVCVARKITWNEGTSQNCSVNLTVESLMLYSHQNQANFFNFFSSCCYFPTSATLQAKLIDSFSKYYSTVGWWWYTVNYHSYFSCLRQHTFSKSSNPPSRRIQWMTGPKLEFKSTS